MIGTFRFYENGELIGEQRNLITDAGKRLILSYLAGHAGNYAGSLVVGASNTAASNTDTELGLEWGRVPVLTISPDYINTLLVYKGRIDTFESGVIYEAGLTSNVENQSQFSSKMILGFDSGSDLWDAGSFVSGARVGSDMLRLAPAASGTVTSSMAVQIDMSGYSNSDEFKLAYNVGNANTASVSIRLYTDLSNYYTYTINTPTSGYKFATFNKSQFIATGTPTWSNITSVAMIVTATAGGAAQIDFDALRISDKDSLNDEGSLVSHTVLGSPITKTVGLPMDIEYTLDITL